MPDSVLILGYGISGRAAAKLAVSQGRKAVIVDEKDGDALRAAATALPQDKVETHFGWTEGHPLPYCELAVVSPGLPQGSKMLKAAEAAGAHLISELEFGFRALPCPVLAITGTNGKTTTTELTTHLLNALGVKAEAAGNIGEGLSEAAIGAKERGVQAMVVEVSSFQLEGVEDFAPAAAALLNIASDHINRHGGMDGYARTKFRIFSKMKPGQARIVNADVMPYWRRLMPPGSPEPVSFSATEKAGFELRDGVISFKGQRVFDMAGSQLKGLHNAENVMAALALAQAFLGDSALTRKETVEALNAFQAGAHRIETFAEWSSIRFIDDSKGTNPHAVVAAVRTVGGSRNVTLILGGLDKEMDFSPLLDVAANVKRAFIIGQCREKILACVKEAFPSKLCGTLEEAVQEACEGACPGDAVMLSPACASMDMFKDYKDRGERFKRAVQAWLKAKPAALG